MSASDPGQGPPDGGRAMDHPISAIQDQILFHGELCPDDTSYHVPWHVRLRGRLDREAFERALHAVVARHAALRTRFVWSGPRRVARVFDEPVVALEHYDLRALAGPRRAAVIARAVDEVIARPFALAADPPIRATLLHVDDEEHRFVLVTHHIVVDGWSLGVLVRELARAYRALRDGRAVDLPEVELQAHEAPRPTEARRDQDLAYWRDALAGAPTEIDLPADRPRPEIATWRGAHHRIRVEPALVAEVTALAQASRVTPFMILLAAFQAVVARLARVQDFLVAVPTANRVTRRLERAVGMFVNLLPIRARLGATTTGRAAIAGASRAVLDGLAHAAVPFVDIVRAMNPPRSRAREPLCQLLFQIAPSLDLDAPVPGLTVEQLPIEDHRSRFDLVVSLWEIAGGLEGYWEYPTDLFDEPTIAGFAERYERLLRALVARPDQPLAALSDEGPIA